MRANIVGAIFIAVLVMAGATANAQTKEATVMPSASLHYSILKGITYKVMTITTNMLFLRAGTGSWVDAGILTTIFTGFSFVLFVANDYEWDRYYLPNQNLGNDNIDLAERLKRTSLKFATYRITLTTISTGILYLWTGSLKTALGVGIALALTKAVMFYVNDFAWDWYYRFPGVRS